MLNPALTSKEGLVNVKLKRSLGCTDHEAVAVLVAVKSVGRRSLPWTKREHTLATSRFSLVECHGIET